LLHQSLLHRKTPTYQSLGDFFEQFALNIADALDSISGSGLLVRGETITTYVGFALRMLSSLLKLYLVYANWEPEENLYTIFTIFELFILISLTFLTIILDALIASIIGIVLALYFFLKELKNIGELLLTFADMHSFTHWLEAVINKNETLVIDNHNSLYMEQLMLRKIVLQRMLCRESKPHIQRQYEIFQKLTDALAMPASIETLLALYAARDSDFKALECLIQHWQGKEDEDLLDAIHQAQQDIITKNHDIQKILAPYNHWNIDIDIQQNEMLILFAEASVGFYLSVAGIALALIGFLMCFSLFPILFPVLYIAPLIFGIIMVILTLAFLITDYIFTQQEEQHLELEILEKANSGKFKTNPYIDVFKPMNQTTFFQKTIETPYHYALP
jgi:hypothetical protein